MLPATAWPFCSRVAFILCLNGSQVLTEVAGSAQVTVYATGCLAAIGIVIGSLETLTYRREFGETGVFSAFRTGPQLLLSPNTVSLVHGVRVLAACVLLVPFKSPAASAGTWTFLALCSMFVAWRTSAGQDGGDQMLHIATLALAVGSILGIFSSVALSVALLFIGAQSCLAYVTAGLAKIVSPAWTRGTAVAGVLSTATYGQEGVFTAVAKQRTVGIALCWMVIAMECAFLAAPVVPQLALLFLLVCGLLFHSINAALMGLNGFLWAFVATYPCILFLNDYVRGLLS